jgi:hypothetical protein
MRSDKQNEASRTNGAKSQGPVSPEGKARSAQNAERHNLCAAGHLVLLTNEDAVEFRHLMDDFIVRFQPVDRVELDLVHKLIAATWREKRIAGMETAIFELEMLRQQPEIEDEYLEISAPARHALALFGTDDTKAATSLLFRYASTVRRAYASALKALKELQGDRFNRGPHTAPQFDRSPITDPTGKYQQGTDQELQAEVESEIDIPAAASRHPAIVSFVILRRRYTRRLALAKNNELPNEPKRAFTAGAGTGAAYAAA